MCSKSKKKVAIFMEFKTKTLPSSFVHCLLLAKVSRKHAHKFARNEILISNTILEYKCGKAAAAATAWFILKVLFYGVITVFSHRCQCHCCCCGRCHSPNQHFAIIIAKESKIQRPNTKKNPRKHRNGLL